MSVIQERPKITTKIKNNFWGSKCWILHVNIPIKVWNDFPSPCLLKFVRFPHYHNYAYVAELPISYFNDGPLFLECYNSISTICPFKAKNPICLYQTRKIISLNKVWQNMTNFHFLRIEYCTYKFWVLWFLFTFIFSPTRQNFEFWFLFYSKLWSFVIQVCLISCEKGIFNITSTI